MTLLPSIVIKECNMKAIIKIGDVTIEADRQLASSAGWTVYSDGTASDHTGYAYARAAQALSEGLTGEDALRRAIAIGEERSFAARQATAAKEAAQISLQAATTRLEAARIEAETTTTTRRK